MKFMNPKHCFLDKYMFIGLMIIYLNCSAQLSEGRKANHNNFSSEPPRNPRPSNIIFLMSNPC